MSKKNIRRGDIVIYRSVEGPDIEVKLKQETVWLNAHFIAKVFGVQRPAIIKHIYNIYKTNELDRKSTCSTLEQVASDGKIRKMNLYNLDMIISVGYRVNSRKATQFRIWANNILKQHIIKGYTLNRKRINRLKQNQLVDLEHTLSLIKKTVDNKHLTHNEETGLLEIITEYANSWVLLNKYDKGKVDVLTDHNKPIYALDYIQCKKMIGTLKLDLISKNQASDLFGREKDKGFEQIISSIYQTFGKKELYTGIERKSANLLYLIIKDHPFIDGNKRIGSFLFVTYLARNKFLLNKRGERKINDNTLVALALLIAQSNPKQKDIIIKLIMNFIK